MQGGRGYDAVGRKPVAAIVEDGQSSPAPALGVPKPQPLNAVLSVSE